ncbi:hypothetical protein [Streptomyces cucumeris]|uniref:hypothetical protein n=1 Tax=Streptomyces cucumeris TaxID=2962890 RepID=UPI0020C84C35|nr:hypothetical protein [Streptomyces sp. NEAU-Y11]MCP9205523.1 hypothetical protein [Streptomyces sp. NEAU-Y11]
MSLTTLTGWATTHPAPAAAAALTAALLTVGTGWAAVRSLRQAARPSAAVVVAAIAAAACTAYSADTSWRFAEHRLGMDRVSERAFMFAAAEIALLACGLMARANMRATKTDTEAGSPGVPGALVWVITGVQVIPAYSESGPVGGTVRAMIGPVLAALLWHLAMGLELRIVRPGALSGGLPAVIGRELRERLLSRLGLAVRDRTAEQITRDRATTRAVQLAARLELQDAKTRRGRRTARRLAAAVARAGVGADPNQRHKLIRELAARRGAAQLATITLRSPWDPEPGPVHPRTPTALARQQLTHLHPFDAIQRVHSANPGLHPAALASLMTEHGVVVSEQMVRVAIGAPNPARTRTPSAPAPAVEPAHPLVLDIATAPEVHPEVRAPALAIAAGQTRSAVHARIPECAPAPEPHPASADGKTAAEEHPDTAPERTPGAVAGAHPSAPEPGLPAHLIEAARALGRPASLRTLKTELGVGQPKAQRLQQLTRED